MWPPDWRCPDYKGPYPIQELQMARRTLINCLVYNNSQVLERVKPKLGLPSAYGPAQTPPPIPQSPETLKKKVIPTSEKSPLIRPLLPELDAVRHIQSPWQKDGSGANKDPPEKYKQRSSTTTLSDVRSSLSLNDSGVDSMHGSSSTPIAKIKLLNSPSHSNLVAIPPAKETDLSPEYQSPTFFSGISKTSPPAATISSLSGAGLKRKLSGAFSSVDSKRISLDSEAIKNPVESSQNKLIHKCDFCSFTSNSQADMEDHLINSQHFSGSLYNAYRKGSSYVLVSIQRMLAVKNAFSKTKALVVVCPDCKDIFEDIFMCGMHYKYKHGTENGFYSICPVIHHETVTISLDPYCKACSTEFEFHRELHRHWEQIPDHHPIVKPVGDRTFALFICPYCQRTFYNDFYACKSHIILHKSGGNQTQGIMAVEMKHILVPMRKIELPPFNTDPTERSGNGDGLADELQILQNMVKHFSQMNGQKTKIKDIKDRMQVLRSFQQGSLVK